MEPTTVREPKKDDSIIKMTGSVYLPQEFLRLEYGHEKDGDGLVFLLCLQPQQMGLF